MRLSPTIGNRAHRAIGVIVMFAVCSAIAAESATVTPDEIVQAALVNSRQLQVDNQETAAARARLKQARAAAGVSVDMDLRASHFEGLENGTLGPGLGLEPIQNRYSAGVTLSQPLYTGGRLKQQRTGATLEVHAATEDRRGSTADLVFTALTAYWNWSKAHAALETMNAAVERTTAHTADLENRHQAGMATDNELFASQVLLDKTRLRLEEARRQVRLALVNLEYLTGREMPAEQQPLPAPPVSADEALPQWAPERLENRAEIHAGRLKLTAAENAVRVQRAADSPQVYLTARYEQARPNLQDFPPEDRWQDDAFIGIVMTWNLFDSGLSRARRAEASARAAQARLQLDEATERIRLEFKTSRIQLENALARIPVTERANESARRNLKSVQDQWEAGLARHSEVLDALAQLTDAQFDAATARADVTLAQAAVSHAEGRLQQSTEEPEGQ